MPNKTTKEILDVTYKQLIASLQKEQTRLHDNWQRIKTRDTDLAEVINSQEVSIAHEIRILETISKRNDDTRIVQLNQTIGELNLIHDKLEQAVPKTEKKSEPWYIEWQKAIADFFRIFSACDKELENRKSQVRLSAKSLQSLGDAALVSSGKAVEISREESMAKQYQDAIKLETERLIEAGFKDFTTGEYDPYVILSEALDQKVTANTDITALWKQIKPIVAGSNEELLGEVDVMIGAMEVMGAEIQRKNGEVQMDKVHGAKAQALAGPERRQRIQSAFKMLNEGQLKRSYDKLHESQVKLDKIERSSSHDEDSPSFRI